MRMRWEMQVHPACEEELRALKIRNDRLLTKVIHDLDLLREFGLELLAEDRVKKLADEVFELRTRTGSDINRVLFGIRAGRLIILVVTFVKKAQRTPPRLIDLAKRRLNEWGERS